MTHRRSAARAASLVPVALVLAVCTAAGRPVRVRLVGSDGLPLASAAATPAGDPAGRRAASQDGCVSLDLPAGVDAACAIAPGHATARVDLPVGFDESEAVLLSGRALRGVVLDAAQQPVVGAQVRATAGAPDGCQPVTVADDTGAFVLDGLEPGPSPAGWPRSGATLSSTRNACGSSGSRSRRNREHGWLARASGLQGTAPIPPPGPGSGDTAPCERTTT
jgi:hypothetical protein